MVKDVLDTAIDALDDFELQAFPDRVIAIPTGQVPTLDFSISQADKEFLYQSGDDTAQQFFAALRRADAGGVRAVRHHRVVGVAREHDPRRQWDLLAAQSVRRSSLQFNPTPKHEER